MVISCAGLPVGVEVSAHARTWPNASSLGMAPMARGVLA